VVSRLAGFGGITRLGLGVKAFGADDITYPDSDKTVLTAGIAKFNRLATAIARFNSRSTGLVAACTGVREKLTIASPIATASSSRLMYLITLKIPIVSSRLVSSNRLLTTLFTTLFRLVLFNKHIIDEGISSQA